MIVDISHYQGEINWSDARKNIDFCIFRASIGFDIDNKYFSHTKQCGVPFGAYHYVKAGTPEEARKEAFFFYETVAQHSVQPLFFVADIEYKLQNKETTKPVALAFCNTLRELGVKKVGLYISQNRYPYTQDSLEQFDFLWLPRYGKDNGQLDENYKPKYPCDLWQYTSKGSLRGAKKLVDLNKLNGLRTLEWFIQGYQERKEENSMAEKFTSKHFVEFCEKFVGRPYWYGTCIYNCTQSRYEDKAKQYPSHYTASRASGYKKHIAAKEVCSDCIGMIKGYAWTNGGDTVFEAIGTGSKIVNKYGSNNCPDKSANGMFSYAKSKGMDWGNIDTIPEIPGIAVRYDGHVGVYVGGGWVVEERGFNYGCQKTRLEEHKWLHWYKLPWINYEEASVPAACKLGDRVLQKGACGQDVIELQKLLIQLGYLNDVADGNFGSKTEVALKEFQKAEQLTPDGNYGEKTHRALMDVIGDKQTEFEDNIQEEEKEVSPESKPVIKVIGESVRVRAGDSVEYKILTTVKEGTLLNAILDKNNEPITSKNGWYAIQCSDTIGWISGKYTKAII